MLEPEYLSLREHPRGSSQVTVLTQGGKEEIGFVL